ncbi:MAG TPA: Tex family protein [Ignavibacteriales bacterium]|nr:Tex family protein [Ignavibacteriales bacterium]
MLNIPEIIARELGIKPNQVIEVINLFNDGATVPFIARYRKERTGGLDEEQIRKIDERMGYLTVLEERKKTILKSIEDQGKLTTELAEKINDCLKLNELEDLYLPYKPKRKTRATVAKAKGLEPLALFILENPKFSGDFQEKLAEFINPELGVKTADEALQGAKDIIAEMINDNAEVRKAVRGILENEATVVSEKVKDKASSKKKVEEKEYSAIEEEDIKFSSGVKNKDRKDVYEIYFEFKCEITKIKPYQILAINRGEKEEVLKVTLSYDKDYILGVIRNTFLPYQKSVFMDILEATIEDAFTRLLYPSIEREIRNLLTEKADLHAIEIFAANLKQLLLQPPLLGKMIMGIDPGYVSGCKIAVIDETGKYLYGNTIYPHPPKNKVEDAEDKIVQAVKIYKVDVIAIGNGTASRETEMLVANIIKKYNLKCHYTIVSEAGASVYSASELAKKEFPDLEAAQRGNISIARRLLDPLAELVKIDPKSIGVGLYQHDVDQKLLSQKLDNVVESCVNYVGVDVNTASSSLLNYVSGLNKRLAQNIVKFRDEHGPFPNREALKKVPGFSEKVFEQAAGFLKVTNSDNVLDNTFIHPESYEPTLKLLDKFKMKPEEIKDKGAILQLAVQQRGTKKLAEEIGVGVPTLEDILQNLAKPGRDPREEMPKPILRSDVLKMEDLQEGMELKGTVRNIVDFGAFVDIGVKQDGLIHISQMGNKFVKNPLEVLSVGDIVDVEVISIDLNRGRIGLKLLNINK